jgi:hypothetical protein
MLALISLAVLAGILCLGLWPFHTPQNRLRWTPEGVSFDGMGTLFSHDAIVWRPPDANGASLEIWAQTSRPGDGDGTLFAFEQPGGPFLWTLFQGDDDLGILQQKAAGPMQVERRWLEVNGVFARSRPILITVTSGRAGTAVYIDGQPAAAAPDSEGVLEGIEGRIVVGDAAGFADSWSGHIRAVALYPDSLSPVQVSRHYQDWRKGGPPALDGPERAIALYRFDSQPRAAVPNLAGSRAALYIPTTYVVLDKLVLEPFWRQVDFGSFGYWEDNFNNIVGLVPVGFFFCAWFIRAGLPKPRIVTVALGFSLSLTIELLQGYWLATRDSGTTDLILNTLGTWIGVRCHGRLWERFIRTFAWLGLGEEQI